MTIEDCRGCGYLLLKNSSIAKGPLRQFPDAAIPNRMPQFTIMNLQ